MPNSSLKLGEILVKEGLLNETQVKEVIKIQKKEGGRFGEILIRLGYVSEEQIVAAIGKQLNIPYLSKAKGLLEPAKDQGLEKLISEDFARTHLLLPISKTMNSLTVAFSDPLDLIVFDNLKKMTKCEINPVIATPKDITAAMDEFYGAIGQLEKAVGASYDTVDVSIEEIGTKEELSIDKLISQAEEAPVIKLVNLLLMQAIKDRASDIHIEPFEKKISIRYRIDGNLYEVPTPAYHLLLPIVSRIKILAKLNIAEKRLPQDGAFHLRVEDRLVDVRTSVIPTVWGEKVVLRILDKTAAVVNLDSLGFEKDDLEKFKAGIEKPYGQVFLTGPTGSGKTTTLYAALNYIKSSKKNILTIEDPVEYRIDGINQVEVKPGIGLTFASGLRSTLRQDPDIILVGEVRDLETAEICVRAALTGHLVLSTLHTNDAPTAITRLIDIGIEPFLVVSSLSLVAAQRLIRKLCPKCKEPYKPTKEVLAKTGLDKYEVKELYKHKGCEHCRNIGYLGRMAIYEVMPIDEELRELILKGPTVGKVREIAMRHGMTTLWDSGLAKVAAGITSLEEIYAVTFKIED